jgi:hypothetical protein
MAAAKHVAQPMAQSSGLSSTVGQDDVELRRRDVGNKDSSSDLEAPGESEQLII